MTPNGHASDIAKAAAIAALSAIATALATWGVEELKKRFAAAPAKNVKK